MAQLQDIVAFLERELKHDDIRDYPGAFNGLQLENSGVIERVVCAVDATLPVVEKVAELGSGSLLIVHHGMFWQGVQPVTGAFRRKLRCAMNADMAIFSSHLPLDVHPQWGNNALLANHLCLKQSSPFLDFKGLAVGLQGGWTGTAEELKKQLEQAVGGEVHLCAAGPTEIKRIGLVTGGAGSEVAQAAQAGVDAFITGEGPHWSYGLAEELGIHLLFGGHYATETFGVKALGAVLEKEFALSWSFVDHSSGL